MLLTDNAPSVFHVWRMFMNHIVSYASSPAKLLNVHTHTLKMFFKTISLNLSSTTSGKEMMCYSPINRGTYTAWAHCLIRGISLLTFCCLVYFLKSLPSMSLAGHPCPWIKLLVGWVAHTGRGEEALFARNSNRLGLNEHFKSAKVIHRNANIIR